METLLEFGAVVNLGNKVRAGKRVHGVVLFANLKGTIKCGEHLSSLTVAPTYNLECFLSCVKHTDAIYK